MAEKKGYVATTKFLIASPTKVRPVANVISNALYANKQLDDDMLYVKEIRIDEGPRLKRVWFRARGRADMLLKRMCHITVVVEEKAGE